METMNNFLVAYYGEGYDMTNAPVVAAEYTWAITIIVISLIALWQARAFVSKF